MTPTQSADPGRLPTDAAVRPDDGPVPEIVVVDPETGSPPDGLTDVLSCHYEVRSTAEFAAGVDLARDLASEPPEAALVTVMAPGGNGTGLDVLDAFRQWCPETALIVRAEPAAPVRYVLAVATTIGPAAILDRATPPEAVAELIADVLRTGLGRIDPSLQAFLPPTWGPGRLSGTLDRLVPGAFAAVLWQALCDAPLAPNGFTELAGSLGMAPTRIVQQVAALADELRVYGVVETTSLELFDFATSARALLAPIVERWCDGRVQPSTQLRDSSAEPLSK